MDTIYTVDSSALHLAYNNLCSNVEFFCPQAPLFTNPRRIATKLSGHLSFRKTFTKRSAPNKTGTCLKGVPTKNLLNVIGLVNRKDNSFPLVP